MERFAMFQRKGGAKSAAIPAEGDVGLGLRELALRHPQDATHPVVEIELVGGVVELGLGDRPDVRSLRHRILAGHQVR